MCINNQPLFPGSVNVGPRFGLQFGGKRVTVTGPCFDENTMDVKCRFGDRDVNGVIVDSVRAVCVTPPQAAVGFIRFQMSLDGGTTFIYDGNFWTSM